MITKRPRRIDTNEFKQQLVQLYLNGKRKCDIIREYDITGVSNVCRPTNLKSYLLL